MTTQTTPTLTPQDHATRRAIAMFKQAVKADRPALSALKAERTRLAKAGDPAASTAQYDLWAAKRDARARHLAYGLLRGQAWSRMESNRPEGDERFVPYVQRAWTAVRTAVAQELGTAPAPSATMLALGVK